MSMVKTIKISDDIHSRLLKIGSMGETFEDVIIKLLDFYESKNKKWVLLVIIKKYCINCGPMARVVLQQEK